VTIISGVVFRTDLNPHNIMFLSPLTIATAYPVSCQLTIGMGVHQLNNSSACVAGRAVTFASSSGTRACQSDVPFPSNLLWPQLVKAFRTASTPQLTPWRLNYEMRTS
jgi:hypothetical protein